MASTDDLVALLYQIRGVSSPLEKLKLAALAWRTLSGLDRHQRLVVAKELGLSGAEHVVEQLGRKGGLSPAALLSAIRHAEQAEPEELGALLGGVMDSDKRTALVADILDVAATSLHDGAMPPATGTAEVSDEAETLPEETETPTSSVDSAVVLKTGPSIAAGTGVSATEPAPSAEPAPGPAPVATPVVESGARARAKAVGVKTAEVPATETAAEHGWATIEEPLRTPERRRVPRHGETSSVALRLTARASVMDRLLALRSSLDALRGASVDELAAAVETFGTGWSRRRALVAVLEVGLPTSLADALELVQRVGDEQTMIWALPVLAGRPGLTESDKASLVDVATGRPAVARRIAMLLAVPESWAQ